MNKLGLIVLLFFIASYSGLSQITQLGNGTILTHPRLLFLQGEESKIQKSINKDSLFASVHQIILKECDVFLNQEPVEQIKTGRRLLDKSRECLRRVFYLSYAYRMTHEDRYFKRAEQELLAVAAFSDWNPSHFLDVAEMTMAAAIGYDWLFDKLSENSRNIIKNAIIKKGLEESFNEKYNQWLKWSSNWNQVCNAGMVYGAIAVYEENPVLSDKIIQRAIQSIKIPMANYGPDGGYAEGPMYWGYGTSFNVLFISAVEKLFNQDFGLSAMPGFLKTADYLLNMISPSGLYFNYSDAREHGEINPAMFWFSGKQKGNNYLLWYEKKYISENPKSLVKERLLPALMIWGEGQHLEKVSAPQSRIWISKGETPVVAIRSSWTDPNATYVGIKGGTPSTSHAHMDEGSFVLETDGIRWVLDPGFQDYESLESKGIHIWEGGEHSQRWNVLRYNNKLHSTLTVNDSLLQVDGSASIKQFGTHSPFFNVVIDLSELYKGYLTKIERGVALAENRYVIVRDEIESGENVATVKWKILTRASVNIKDAHTAFFLQGGKELTLKIESTEDIHLQTWTAQPSTSYDAPNPGMVLVGFEVRLPANTKTSFTAQFLSNGLIPLKNIPMLQNWNR